MKAKFIYFLQMYWVYLLAALIYTAGIVVFLTHEHNIGCRYMFWGSNIIFGMHLLLIWLLEDECPDDDVFPGAVVVFAVYVLLTAVLWAFPISPWWFLIVLAIASWGVNAGFVFPLYTENHSTFEINVIAIINMIVVGGLYEIGFKM